MSEQPISICRAKPSQNNEKKQVRVRNKEKQIGGNYINGDKRDDVPQSMAADKPADEWLFSHFQVQKRKSQKKKKKKGESW